MHFHVCVIAGYKFSARILYSTFVGSERSFAKCCGSLCTETAEYICALCVAICPFCIALLKAMKVPLQSAVVPCVRKLLNTSLHVHSNLPILHSNFAVRYQIKLIPLDWKPNSAHLPFLDSYRHPFWLSHVIM